MTAAELSRLAADLGLDVVGAAPAEPYSDTERHIRDRRERGLFARMRFTMARPEVSCHPERLLDGARTVVSAALCYYEAGREATADEGRLPRYTWRDGYQDLRDRLDALGRRLGGSYRVLVDSNDHVDREAAVRAGVGFYGRNTMVITSSHGSWVVLGTLVTDVEVEATPALELDCASTRAPRVRSTIRARWTRTAASRTGRRRPSPYPTTIERSSGRWSTGVTSARTCARGTTPSRNGAQAFLSLPTRHRSST
jgi:epoxyqueuosine reductase QueG